MLSSQDNGSIEHESTPEPVHEPTPAAADQGVSLQSRTAAMVFVTALAAVLAAVGVILASERSALRRADADLFGALGDQAARAIIGHVDSAHGDLSGPAFDAVRSEIVLLAETKGIRQVALYFGDGDEVLSARSAQSAQANGASLPLPTVSGPGRILREDHLTVARPFRMRASDTKDAMLVVEAGYPGVKRRMRDLISLSGRIVGLSSVLLVFLCPILSRWLLLGLVRSAERAREGEAVRVADGTRAGAEVADLCHRMERDQDRIRALEAAQAGIIRSAKEHIAKIRAERDGHVSVAEAARKEARAATAAKAAFVANTSHEIRTPLHAVLGANALLLETELDAEQAALAERSRHASETLLALVEDVLDMARFDSRELRLEHEAFNPGELVESVAELSAPLAAKKDLELVSYVAPVCPDRLMGDADRIRQALMRLIDNAIKFTDRGTVKVTLTWETGDGGEPVAIFTVSDTGVGIEEEERARLFQAFEQLDSSDTRRHGGVGLGLALVARIARASCGEVEVTSHRGQGTTFRLLLPLEIEQRETLRLTGGERPDPTPLEGVAILLLEDSDIAAETLAQTLMDLGATVHLESSTYAGFECLHHETVDVVLLDSLLPGRDAFLGALETNEQYGVKPVVLLTPAHGSKLPADARDEAVSALLPKPLSRKGIIDALGRVLKPDEQGPKDPMALTGPELFESKIRRRVRVLLVEDNHTNQQLVQYILGKRGYQVDVASNGRRAVDACAVGEYDAILMDCQMPEMDGYEATCRIRALEAPRGRRTPILAMTASILDSDRARCMTAGMDDMISKPFQPHQMVEWLESWLMRSLYVEEDGAPVKKRTTQKDAMAQLARSAEPAPALPSVEGDALGGSVDASLVEGALDSDILGALLDDEEGRLLASELIEGFLEITPTKLKEMEEAVQTERLEECASIAHGLVSTSGTVGAMRLAKMLREVESFARKGNGFDSARVVKECRDEVDVARLALLRAMAS